MQTHQASVTGNVRSALWVKRRDRAAFWNDVPTWARAAFLLAVFFSFSQMGFITDILSFGATSRWRLVAEVISGGVIAVLYAMCAFRGVRWFGLAAGVHVLSFFLVVRYVPAAQPPAWLTAPGLDPLRARLVLDGVGCMFGMVLGYVLFVTFISTEGQRYLRVHTEMVLAERIHHALVPALDARDEVFELCGRSFPSGEVGGDLVDAVTTSAGCLALVADVSGHGVPSGVLTAMVKSAFRMRVRTESRPDRLLYDLNETLVPMIEPNMFVTAACVYRSDTGTVTLAAAGHPPLLHYRRAAGDVVEHATSNVALGLFAGRAYASTAIDVAPGDVLLLLTDGLLEVFNRSDVEFGLAGVADVLRKRAAEPLPVIADALRAAALVHGPQTDDQTLLLMRV
jgi:serine phosphatase RsbU (regulator of sigma subunit)